MKTTIRTQQMRKLCGAMCNESLTWDFKTMKNVFFGTATLLRQDQVFAHITDLYMYKSIT
jgi:hypothetical protein